MVFEQLLKHVFLPRFRDFSLGTLNCTHYFCHFWIDESDNFVMIWVEFHWNQIHSAFFWGFSLGFESGPCAVGAVVSLLIRKPSNSLNMFITAAMMMMAMVMRVGFMMMSSFCSPSYTLRFGGKRVVESRLPRWVYPMADRCPCNRPRLQSSATWRMMKYWLTFNERAALEETSTCSGFFYSCFSPPPFALFSTSPRSPRPM